MNLLVIIPNWFVSELTHQWVVIFSKSLFWLSGLVVLNVKISVFECKTSFLSFFKSSEYSVYNETAYPFLPIDSLTDIWYI